MSLFFPDKYGTLITVYPDLMRRAIITASQQISFYQITQTDLHSIDCYLEFYPGKNETSIIQKAVKSQLIEKLDGLNINQIDINFVNSYAHETGSKLRRVKNEYSNIS